MVISSKVADVEMKGLEGEIKYVAKRWFCFFPNLNNSFFCTY